MVNPNKRVKRPNGLGNVYNYKTDEEGNVFTLPIKTIIKENYIYLYRAINDEDYFIVENDTCFFFKEILYDEEVVGFATYKTTQINKDALVMQYFYVLPEYRNKGLLEEEIDESAALFESSIILEYPTRDMVEALTKHKLARIFDDRFVVSRIPFSVPMFSLEDVQKGIVREEYDTTGTKGYYKMSHLYDLELCTVVGLASEDVDSMYDEENVDEENINNYNIISLPLRDDVEKYDCINKRAESQELNDGTYFKNVKKFLDENDDVIQNWLTIY